MCSITKHCTPHPTACLSGCGCWCVCCHVYLLSCLYVVSSDALRSSVFTDLRRGGACNQGGKAQNFYYGGVTRRHSFGECLLKKKPVKQRVSFHKPTGGFVRVPLLNSELMERCYFFFHPEQLRYQYCVQEIGVYNDKTYF